MKKNFAFSLILVVIDQVAKLIIWHNYSNVDVVLLTDILFFRPVQNTNLSWVFSMLNYKSPVLLMVAIQVLALIIVFLLYRYFSYLWTQGQKLLNRMLIFFVAGIICSFIDVVFWGGSLDFIRLFDWFTFDFKDVYFKIGIAFLLFYTIDYYTKSYYKMSKKERQQTSIWIWIKNGMPNIVIFIWALFGLVPI